MNCVVVGYCDVDVVVVSDDWLYIVEVVEDGECFVYNWKNVIDIII